MQLGVAGSILLAKPSKHTSHALASWFSPIPTHQRVFLAASGVSAGSEGKPTRITLPLSSLLAVCCKIRCAATYSATWAFCVHPCPSLQVFSTALLGIFCIFDTAMGKEETSKWNRELCLSHTVPRIIVEERDVECPLGGFGPACLFHLVAMDAFGLRFSCLPSPWWRCLVTVVEQLPDVVTWGHQAYSSR